MKPTLFLAIALLVVPYAGATLAQDPEPRDMPVDAEPAYEIDDDLLIETRDGAQISAIVVRKRGIESPLPTILQFTIYVRPSDVESLKAAADRGYVGAIAYTRGKHKSPDSIVPYEFDGADAHDTIDWISKQAWSNGKVAMYGGSYNGFTQWAAAKTLHPALKTIVPYVANCPGMGLPMENGVFVNPNYEWTFYVTNNKTLDNEVGNDRARFREMQNKWWETGAPYRSLDRIDGTPNKWFQRWLDHPNYDKYWQAMVPYEDDFAQITIPVLTIDGYFNDSQGSGLNYVRQHRKHGAGAEHYLILGPYDHFGAQRGGQPIVRGIEVDPVAILDLGRITFDWFDYVLKDGPKPEILKDKVNYQVMGTNTWESAPTLAAMSTGGLKFFLRGNDGQPVHRLDPERPKVPGFLEQVVDFTDRESSNNNSYPDPILHESIDTSSGFIFESEPLPKSVTMNGAPSGEFVVSINKRDVDIGFALYELTPAGQYFQLTYYVGRASYERNKSERELLTPNAVERVPFSNTRLISKKLAKGSRLVAYINVNRNPFSQINYGTGKDVSDESAKDAGEDLIIRWWDESNVEIPVRE